MKVDKVVAALNALDKWHRGETPILDVCTLLGDTTGALSQMLTANDVADYSGKPVDGFSFQAVVNVVILYLAMRHAKPK